VRLSSEYGQELGRDFEEFKKVRFTGVFSSAFATEEAEKEAAAHT
jgi:hypothetical protein